MSNGHEEHAVEVSDLVDEDAEARVSPEDGELDPEEQPNYTDRHPEHFRKPPGHVREFRDEDSDSEA
jgi:hypothetical protein